jgi:hypothetical protein
MKQAKMQCVVRAGLVILVCLLFFAVSTESFAETVAVQGMSYNVAASLKDNLNSLTGKEVFISLRSGKTYQGRVKSVGDHFIHFEKIAGKDFYDALIRMEDISAVEAKFRGLQ